MNEIESDDTKLIQVYEIEECIKWVQENNFNAVALQFPRESLCDATQIVLILQRRTSCKYYVSLTSMCSVDYLSVKHLGCSAIQAIIYFGNVCLSSIYADSPPVLYVFGRFFKEDDINFVKEAIQRIESKHTLILYDTTNIYLVKELINMHNDENRILSMAKINSISSQWNFTSSTREFIEDKELEEKVGSTLGPFVIPNDINEYDLVVYVGNCRSLNLKLSCSQLLEVDINKRNCASFSSSKELRKRVSQMEKFKQNSCSLIGVIFTNPLPDVNEMCTKSKQLAKRVGKKVYFITMVQTLDEYKLGNFPQLNAFVVSNSCWCSVILDSLHSHVPVLTWTEFEISCGLVKNYGGVEWNKDKEDQVDDEIDVNDDNVEKSIQLNPNELISSEILKKHSWYGLQANAGQTDVSLVKDGQKGIASSYQNEPDTK